MPDSPVTVVLIHGAWAGSWVWDRLAPCLRARGLAVLAPDLPGCGERLGDPREASLQRCVSDLESTLSGVSGPLLLVGHSGGGVVATQLAEVLAERTLGVAYLAGMMLPSGTGFGDLVASMVSDCPEAAGIGPHLVWDKSAPVSRVPPAAIRDIFLQDLPEDEVQQVISRFGPQAEGSRALVPNWTAQRFGRLPRLYIEARKDRSVVLPVQREMQQRVPGASVVTLDTGHVPQVIVPEAVADHLARFAATANVTHPTSCATETTQQ